MNHQTYNLPHTTMARASVSNQRPSSTSNTSSAYSPYAYPNEDWTKISDLAERRRIQNRIAQRNYRQKLKRRLEDLERRAFSTSTSPEPTPSKQKSQQQAQRPPHTKSKSGTSIPTKNGWNGQHSPTPSLRNSVSSFDEEVTLSQYGYGLPSPSMERSTMSSYAMNEQTAPATYSQEPWYQNPASSSYGSSYTAWNSAATPMYSSGQSVAHVKEEQRDEDMHAYNLNNYGAVSSTATSSLRGSESYPGSHSQSYTPSLSDSLEDSFNGSYGESPELFGTWPTPPPSVAADDTFFSAALAQALAADDPLFLTPSIELGNDAFSFLA